MNILSFINTFLKERDLSKPSGKHIFSYRISDNEYFELEKLLLSDSYKKSIDLRVLGAIFLYAVESWRRNYNASNRSWSFTNIEKLNIDRSEFVEKIMQKACDFWGININESKNRFLDTISINAGISKQQLENENFRRSCYKIVENYDDYTDLDVIISKEFNANLYDQELIKHLVETIKSIRQEYSLDTKDNPYEYLRNVESQWSKELPFQINDSVAEKFINKLFRKANRAAIKINPELLIQHAIRKNKNADFVSCFNVTAPNVLPEYFNDIFSQSNRKPLTLVTQDNRTIATYRWSKLEEMFKLSDKKNNSFNQITTQCFVKDFSHRKLFPIKNIRTIGLELDDTTILFYKEKQGSYTAYADTHIGNDPKFVYIGSSVDLIKSTCLATKKSIYKDEQKHFELFRLLGDWDVCIDGEKNHLSETTEEQRKAMEQAFAELGTPINSGDLFRVNASNCFLYSAKIKSQMEAGILKHISAENKKYGKFIWKYQVAENVSVRRYVWVLPTNFNIVKGQNNTLEVYYADNYSLKTSKGVVLEKAFKNPSFASYSLADVIDNELELDLNFGYNQRLHIDITNPFSNLNLFSDGDVIKEKELEFYISKLHTLRLVGMTTAISIAIDEEIALEKKDISKFKMDVFLGDYKEKLQRYFNKGNEAVYITICSADEEELNIVVRQFKYQSDNKIRADFVDYMQEQFLQAICLKTLKKTIKTPEDLANQEGFWVVVPVVSNSVDYKPLLLKNSLPDGLSAFQQARFDSYKNPNALTEYFESVVSSFEINGKTDENIKKLVEIFISLRNLYQMCEKYPLSMFALFRAIKECPIILIMVSSIFKDLPYESIINRLNICFDLMSKKYWDIVTKYFADNQLLAEISFIKEDAKLLADAHTKHIFSKYKYNLARLARIIHLDMDNIEELENREYLHEKLGHITVVPLSQEQISLREYDIVCYIESIPADFCLSGDVGLTYKLKKLVPKKIDPSKYVIFITTNGKNICNYVVSKQDFVNVTPVLYLLRKVQLNSKHTPEFKDINLTAREYIELTALFEQYYLYLGDKGDKIIQDVNSLRESDQQKSNQYGYVEYFGQIKTVVKPKEISGAHKRVAADIVKYLILLAYKGKLTKSDIDIIESHLSIVVDVLQQYDDFPEYFKNLKKINLKE